MRNIRYISVQMPKGCYNLLKPEEFFQKYSMQQRMELIIKKLVQFIDDMGEVVPPKDALLSLQEAA
ncbi:MAG: hypothetical protein HC842_05225 [Cytophagales bacterium]|nr:hypothetical protein [Cytophagales bacterium]